MKILKCNSNGKQVSIAIVCDHHLTGKWLFTGISVIESNLDWIKLVWHQVAEVT